MARRRLDDEGEEGVVVVALGAWLGLGMEGVVLGR